MKISGPRILATSCSDGLKMSKLGPALSELSFEEGQFRNMRNRVNYKINIVYLTIRLIHHNFFYFNVVIFSFYDMSSYTFFISLTKLFFDNFFYSFGYLIPNSCANM